MASSKSAFAVLFFKIWRGVCIVIQVSLNSSISNTVFNSLILQPNEFGNDSQDHSGPSGKLFVVGLLLYTTEMLKFPGKLSTVVSQLPNPNPIQLHLIAN